MKTKIALCVILPFMLVACATVNVKMTPKHQVALGWVYYNKVYDDYVRLRALPDPSENERAVMKAEYDMLVISWPLLVEASKAIEEGKPISDAAILVIFNLMKYGKEMRF